jgi:nucleotide-binding universal stress UspA family protein
MLPLRTILHPTDFSPAAAHAFGLACSLARDHGARLVVLHVYPPPVCHGEVVARRQGEGYEEELWRMLSRVRPQGSPPEVEHRLAEGDAAEEILRIAREEPCDLVVLGTVGRTGLRRLLLGSTAEKVVCRAPCAVLTVKAPASEGAASGGVQQPAHS